MESAFCGSFSKTTFNDLYYINRGSNHTHTTIYEILDYDIVNVQYNTDWQDVKKKYNSSYLLAFMTDDSKKIITDLNNNTATMLDTFKGKTLEECLSKHKEAMSIGLDGNRIDVFINKHGKFYVDDFTSITTAPFNGFYDVDGSTYPKFVLENVMHD